MSGQFPDWLAPLTTSEAMRAADAAAIADGTPGELLMERAGRGLAQFAAHLLPAGPIAVLCGKGNNGGDGYVAARLLQAAGREVRVLTTSAAEDSTGDAKHHLDKLAERPRPFEPAALVGCAGAIDALLGTGTTGAPRGATARAVRALKASGLPTVACDIPSGVDADTGAVRDPDLAVRALATVTFAAAKPGLWIAPGKGHAGAVHVVDIAVRADQGARLGLLCSDEVLDVLPSRHASSTKFSGGHVVACGGSRGLTGAVCLTSEAAARAGAGYVTACVPRSLEAIYEVKLTEVMTRGLPDDGDGTLVPVAADPVLQQVDQRGGVLSLGGGLSRADGALAFARDVALRAQGPLVLDADAIAAFAGDPEALAARSAVTVVTPHAGELGRLLGLDSAQVDAARLDCATQAARRADAVVVLKGDDTLVATPDGRVAVSEGGAPALATAGTGDVLAGVVAAFLAAASGSDDDADPWALVCAAVRAHLLAGRAAALPHGPDGVVASDVVAALAGAIASGRYAGAQ